MNFYLDSKVGSFGSLGDVNPAIPTLITATESGLCLGEEGEEEGHETKTTAKEYIERVCAASVGLNDIAQILILGCVPTRIRRVKDFKFKTLHIGAREPEYQNSEAFQEFCGMEGVDTSATSKMVCNYMPPRESSNGDLLLTLSAKPDMSGDNYRPITIELKVEETDEFEGLKQAIERVCAVYNSNALVRFAASMTINAQGGKTFVVIMARHGHGRDSLRIVRYDMKDAYRVWKLLISIDVCNYYVPHASSVLGCINSMFGKNPFVFGICCLSTSASTSVYGVCIPRFNNGHIEVVCDQQACDFVIKVNNERYRALLEHNAYLKLGAVLRFPKCYFIPSQQIHMYEKNSTWLRDLKKRMNNKLNGGRAASPEFCDDIFQCDEKFGACREDDLLIVMLYGHHLTNMAEFQQLQRPVSMPSPSLSSKDSLRKCIRLVSNDGSGSSRSLALTKRKKTSPREQQPLSKATGTFHSSFFPERSWPDDWSLIGLKMRGILETLSLIHSLGYCHCDIRPCNVLYFRELNRFSLIDFDLARETNAHFTFRNNGEQFRYARIFIESVSDGNTVQWTPEMDFRMTFGYMLNRTSWAVNDVNNLLS